MNVKVSMNDGAAISLELPQKVVLEVTDTEPATKGQTASSSYKPAVLSNGIRTAVPPFITVGTRIVVMTADGFYVERAKDLSNASQAATPVPMGQLTPVPPRPQ